MPQKSGMWTLHNTAQMLKGRLTPSILPRTYVHDLDFGYSIKSDPALSAGNADGCQGTRKEREKELKRARTLVLHCLKRPVDGASKDLLCSTAGGLDAGCACTVEVRSPIRQ